MTQTLRGCQGNYISNWPMIVSIPGSGPSLSGVDRLRWLCRILSRGMDAGRCWRAFLFPALLSTWVGWESPVLCFLSYAASANAILVFFRPLAGALAVLRRRWSVMDRLRGGTPIFVSTEDLELLLNKPLKPRSWRPWETDRDKERIQQMIFIWAL